jgi:hypothetical protein
MSGNLARVEQGNYLQTADDIKAQVNRIQEVMKAVMKGPSKDHPNGVHYGVIPGTDKPTLLKPGAEVLQATFRIAPSYDVQDLSTPDSIRYRVTATGTHQLTGIVLGAGMGEASSNEEKYKWRKASNKEFDLAPVDRRRIKYGYNKQERREYEIKQIRTEIADVANTILKMACKRAQVAMVLNVTAASDIFHQDLEEMPEELIDTGDEPQGSGQQPAGNGGAKQQTKPPYPDDKFKENLPQWKELVASGKKTVKAILATVESKFTLSNEQHSQISSMGEQQQ